VTVRKEVASSSGVIIFEKTLKIFYNRLFGRNFKIFCSETGKEVASVSVVNPLRKIPKFYAVNSLEKS